MGLSYQQIESKVQSIRKSIKSDVSDYVANIPLPDVTNRVDAPRNHRGGHRVEGMPLQQSFTLHDHHIRITLFNMPEEYADLDTQRNLRSGLYELVAPHREASGEDFGVAVVTKGLCQNQYRKYEDLLETAVYRATKEVKEKNGGVLPESGLILTDVPHRYWIC